MNSTGRKKPCYICLSPFRKRIESALARRTIQRKIAQRWQRHFACSLETLRSKLSRHKNNHAKLFKSATLFALRSGNTTSLLPIETYAQLLLKHGMTLLNYSPGKFKPKDIIAAQELLLKKQKLDIREKALRDTIRTISKLY